MEVRSHMVKYASRKAKKLDNTRKVYKEEELLDIEQNW